MSSETIEIKMAAVSAKRSIELLAEFRILKHEGEYLFLHKGDVLKCLKYASFYRFPCVPLSW